jgi:hypothetical protein
MNDRYIWNGKPVNELTGDELRAWLQNRQQLFTHSVEIEGISLSMVNPEVLDGRSGTTERPRESKKEAG